MRSLKKYPPIIGFAAWSGTGKTTLFEKIIPLLSNSGLRVAIVKHAHHDFDIDHPGKDSFRLRKAGAIDTIVASANRWALIHENIENLKEPNLYALLDQINSHQLDLILVEGFKHEPIPRIELYRSELLKPLLYPDDKEIIAIATDCSDKISHSITQLDINNPDKIVEFIQHYISLIQIQVST
ncbi:MAG: molybdopterin-guanine dinucleotide biosynthesis protein B [Gammaproteobacteria bacterium]|nr:molybdopterin-guanine dinucleotide biosynthesis protein B [Gammaproteobacteria bacterium]